MNICVAVFYSHFLFNPAFGGQLRWTEYELVAFLEIINYNLAASVPLTATPNRSQGGRVPLASRGQRPRRRQAKPPHEVRILRAEHGYSARRRAVKRPKSAKGVWVGETNEVCLRNVRVFPHKQHIQSSHDYPPKQSGGLFRKNITHLNYSFHQRNRNADFLFTA